VAAALRGAGFPANRQDLVNHARLQSPDKRTLRLVEELPLGIYRNLIDVRDRLRHEQDGHDRTRLDDGN
jgi:Protein of unknown function (DUF2795)